MSAFEAHRRKSRADGNGKLKRLLIYTILNIVMLKDLPEKS
jgi:hypothetical protein